jgi:hypothetical protein
MQARNPEKRRNPFVVLACVLFPALILLSFLSPGEKSALHTTGRFHISGHLLAFTVLAYIVARTSRSVRVRMALFLACLLCGVAIEVGEHLVYRSTLEWIDMLADGGGVLIGTVLALLSTPAPRDV